MPMRISAIAAMARNRVIGKDNALPWHLPADLRFFKQTTMGHPVILGRRNYLSLGRPLPGRTNIIVTRNPDFVSSGCIVVHSFEDALQKAYEKDQTEVFVIGGGEIYSLAMNYLDRIYLTEIDLVVDGDVFFPEIDPVEWSIVSESPFSADAKNPYDFVIRVYERILSAQHTKPQ
jgi:dihydrofolate reductase